MNAGKGGVLEPAVGGGFNRGLNRSEFSRGYFG
jgi:hypothetical protein